MSSVTPASVIIRGACMECRRLKTKCDRSVPCAQCIKRGCEAICPSGLRARGSKHSNVEVEQLQKNAASMTSRIRHLEHALAVSQAQLASHTNAQAVGYPPGAAENGFAPPVLDSLFNPAACPSSHAIDRDGVRRQTVICQLPSESEALNLVDRYYQNFGWVYAPIIKSRVMGVIFGRVYTSPVIASNAEIAIMCAIFALGAEFGPAFTAPSAHGRNYLELSMQALHLDDVYAEPTVETVEALALQAKWHFATNQDQAGANRSFSFIGFTMRIAITIGLHRDPKLHGFDDEECRRRRRLWYEISTFEAWQCLLYKRPMSCHSQFTDVEPPYDTEETLGSEPAFFRFKHSFSAEAIIPAVHEVLSCTTPPLYSTVLKIDKKVRASAYPSKLQFVNLREASMEALMQSQEMTLARDIALIRLHRDHFLQAIEESPEDPVQSYAGHSVTTVIETSIGIWKRLRSLSVSCPHLIPRIAWACQPVLGTLTDLALFIRKCPNAPSTAQSYIQFEMGCKVLSDAAEDNVRIAHYIPMLAELRREVHNAVPHLCEGLRNALRERQQQQGSQSGSPPMPFPLPTTQPAGSTGSAGPGDSGMPTRYTRPSSRGSSSSVDLTQVASYESFTQYATGATATPVDPTGAPPGAGLMFTAEPTSIDYFPSQFDTPFVPPSSVVDPAAVPYYPPASAMAPIGSGWFDFTGSHAS